MTSLTLKCKNCEAFGRETDAVMDVPLGMILFPLCERCGVSTMQFIDVQLGLWSDATGSKIYVGGQEKSWESLGLQVDPTLTEGYTSSPCPICQREGEPVFVDINLGVAKCRMCAADFNRNG